MQRMKKHVATLCKCQKTSTSTCIDVVLFLPSFFYKNLPQPCSANRPSLSFHGAGFFIYELNKTFCLLLCLVISPDFKHPGRLQEPRGPTTGIEFDFNFFSRHPNIKMRGMSKENTNFLLQEGKQR